MLPAILILATIQLSAAYGCYAAARHRGGGGFVLAALGGVLGFFIFGTTVLSITLALQYLLLTVLGLVCFACNARDKTFIWSGLAGSLIVVALVGVWLVQGWSAERAQHPMETLTDRLAYESRHSNTPVDQLAAREVDSDDVAIETAAVPSVEQLAALDNAYDEGRDWSSNYYAQVRRESLRLVHASHVEQFVQSEGFGISRMPPPSPGAIDLIHKPDQVPLPTELAPATSADSEQDRGAESLEPLAGSLRSDVQELHRQSLTDFANPTTFGYIESHQRVAGFLPHAFSQLPKFQSQRQWGVAKVELVSLLKHDQPMVYISANLPNMSELGSVPVRPLDAFEQRSLRALVAGEDLETASTATRIRMLGAIRAAKQCLDCHTVEHGALLGAFSYELRPAGSVERSTVDKPAVEPPPAEPARQEKL